MSKPIPGNEEPEEIIEDLESIKDLLNEEEQTGDPDVPLLDDPLEERVHVEEGLTDDTFHALLGDAWRDSVEDIFAQARQRIERNSALWAPDDTDELADALNAQASFVPGSLTLVSVPAGADTSGTSANGGAAGTGVLDIRNLPLPTY